jgi:hypothetical protein
MLSSLLLMFYEEAYRKLSVILSGRSYFLLIWVSYSQSKNRTYGGSESLGQQQLKRDFVWIEELWSRNFRSFEFLFLSAIL